MQFNGWVYAHLTLDEGEAFKFTVPTGPIMVDHIAIRDHEQLWVRGRAIKVDGTLAYFKRDGFLNLSDIPTPLRAYVENAIGYAMSARVNLANVAEIVARNKAERVFG